MREKEIKGRSGWLMLILLVALLILSIYSLVSAIQTDAGYLALGWIVLLIVDIACLCGFTVINPNEAKVIQLFGMYKGSIKQPGLWWGEPVDAPAPGFPSHTQFREQQAEGQRPGWQPYRDRRGGGMEGGGDGRSHLFASTTTSISSTCRANPPCAAWPPPIPTTRTWKGRCRCACR